MPREEVRADPTITGEGLEVVQVVGATGQDNIATALVKLKNKTFCFAAKNLDFFYLVYGTKAASYPTCFSSSFVLFSVLKSLYV